MRCPYCRRPCIKYGASLQCVPCERYWSARPYRKHEGTFFGGLVRGFS